MKIDKYLADWLEQIIQHDNVLHVLTHGGYIEDCEGNSCCDETPVTFEYKDVKLVLNGVLKWDDKKKMFKIFDSTGVFTTIYSTEWFKKREGNQ